MLSNCAVVDGLGCCLAFFETRIVHGEALDGIFLNDGIGPFAELDSLGGIDLVADGDNCFQVVVLRFIRLAVGGNYSKRRNRLPDDSERRDIRASKPQLFFAPLLHGEEDGHEAFALRGEGVFHPWGHLAEIGACEEAVGHQFSELLGKGGLGYVPDAAPELPEMPHVFKGDIEVDLDLPFSSDHALDGGDGSAALHFLAPPSPARVGYFLRERTPSG